ncbi:MAG TPA: hypothetical protein VHJ20_01855 [Polyangia bacterium]|nr:hypothetical protein [Polyangia bacterium]
MRTNLRALTRALTIVVAATTCATAPRPAAAQEITVTETGGQRSAGGAKTSLEFASITDENVPVNRVIASATSTTGNSAMGFTTLCTTPCKLDVDPGFYRLRFGGGSAFDPGVDLSVNGGRHAYDVRPTRYGCLLGGIGLASAGLLVGIMGFAVTEGSYADGTNHVSTAGRVMNVTGLVATLLGGYLAFGPGLGKVEERR